MKTSPEQFANRARTTLSAPVEAGAHSISIEDGSAFPPLAQFRIIVDEEIMIVTGGAGSVSWSVVRGAEGTRAAPHAVHAPVTHIVTAGALETLRHPWFDVRAFGARGDGKTDDTEAIQAALDAAGAQHGIAYVPASPTPYVFSALTLPAYVRLVGAHMRQTQLQRIRGAPGSALRDRPIADGNRGGATGIWIENLTIDGNNGEGDGIDLGNQGSQLSTAAGLTNVFATRFPKGAGIRLNANAVAFGHLYTTENQIGIAASGGGANVFHSVWSEYNTVHQLQVGDVGDSFFGCQFEDDRSGTNAVLRVDGHQNAFYGVYVAIANDKQHVILNSAGANRNAYYGVSLDAGHHTFANLVWHAGVSVGTGPSDFLVHSFVVGESAGAASWYVNGSTGRAIRTAGDVAHFGGGLATRVVDGAPSDHDFVDAIDGMLVVDAKHGRLYVRVHGAWRAVALT